MFRIAASVEALIISCHKPKEICLIAGSGNCCVVSDIAECADVVEDKAVVFQKSSVDDLQDKFQMLCDEPKLVMAYKRDAAEFVVKKYNWDDIVQKTLGLYEER